MINAQLILLQFKPDGNITFVDFLIVINSKYAETRMKNVNNKLGIDQKNSGLNLAPSFMEGKRIGWLYYIYIINHIVCLSVRLCLFCNFPPWMHLPSFNASSNPKCGPEASFWKFTMLANKQFYIFALFPLTFLFCSFWYKVLIRKVSIWL